jgi:hypothetical protein
MKKPFCIKSPVLIRQLPFPLLDSGLGPAPVVGAGVREVDDQLEGLVAEGLEGEDDVVDEEVAVRLADLVAPRDVVEDGVAGTGGSGLKKRQ